MDAREGQPGLWAEGGSTGRVRGLKAGIRLVGRSSWLSSSECGNNFGGWACGVPSAPILHPKALVETKGASILGL